MMTENNIFHELGVALLARRLLLDYRIAITMDSGVEPESYAESWMSIFICGPQEFKDEIMLAFSELLVKGNCRGELHQNL